MHSWKIFHAGPGRPWIFFVGKRVGTVCMCAQSVSEAGSAVASDSMNHAADSDSDNDLLLSRLSVMIADRHMDNASIHAFITVCILLLLSLFPSLSLWVRVFVYQVN